MVSGNIFPTRLVPYLTSTFSLTCSLRFPLPLIRSRCCALVAFPPLPCLFLLLLAVTLTNTNLSLLPFFICLCSLPLPNVSFRFFLSRSFPPLFYFLAFFSWFVSLLCQHFRAVATLPMVTVQHLQNRWNNFK